MKRSVGIPGNKMPNTPEAAANILVRVYGDALTAEDHLASIWQLLACFHVQDLMDVLYKIEQREKASKKIL